MVGATRQSSDGNFPEGQEIGIRNRHVDMSTARVLKIRMSLTPPIESLEQLMVLNRGFIALGHKGFSSVT